MATNCRNRAAGRLPLIQEKHCNLLYNVSQINQTKKVIFTEILVKVHRKQLCDVMT